MIRDTKIAYTFSSFTFLYCFLAFIKQSATRQGTHRVNLCFTCFLSVKAFAVMSDRAVNKPVNKPASKIFPVSSPPLWREWCEGRGSPSTPGSGCPGRWAVCMWRWERLHQGRSCRGERAMDRRERLNASVTREQPRSAPSSVGGGGNR